MIKQVCCICKAFIRLIPSKHEKIMETHGMCDKCLERQLREIDEWKKKIGHPDVKDCLMENMACTERCPLEETNCKRKQERKEKEKVEYNGF